MSSLPKYRQVADRLSAEIAAGRLKAGDQIPPERTFAEDLGISRATVRMALRHLAEREQHTGGAPNKTEVVMLEAQLLGIEDLGEGYMASIEFSGMIREEAHAAPNPFREVWNMTKPKTGGAGWLVAGVQAFPLAIAPLGNGQPPVLV